MASCPQVSLIRLAARPVGAVSAKEIFSLRKMSVMALMTVVLPVPGPPVTTVTPPDTASRMARFCCSSYSKPYFSSRYAVSSSTPSSRTSGSACESAASRSVMSRSAL